MSGTCGVGGWGGPLPGDPSNNSTLTATPAFGGIDVSWTLPTTNPYAVAYTKLYRSATANFGSAILIKEVLNSFWFDRIETPTLYYYWIKIVSVNGTEGALIGPVSATAKPTIEGMIEVLTGEIDAGMLAVTLKNDLDQISILNTNLLNEITDRETGETTLATAMADVEAGVAAAHTFILNEINTRTSETSALSEQIDGLVVTLGDDIASVTTTLTAMIDDTNDIIGAMYVAKVNVNGLIGGFGLYNDGTVVEAGFDVDKFWIGRTGADKMKPFIIADDVVYIKQAVIPILTASKIDTRGLSIKDALGNVILSAGVPLDYARVNGRPKLFRAMSRGLSDTQAPFTALSNSGGVADAETNTLLMGTSNMYTVHKIARSTGVHTLVGYYNPLTNGITAANAMAAALNAIGSDHIVVVTTWDEPQGNRLLGNLPAAMYRCGASRAIFGSPQFQYRGAYVLVGIGGCGEGNGYEAYSGSVVNDTDAWCDVAFTLQAGQLIVSGSAAKPRTLADYSYVGDLNATNGATWGVNVGGANRPEDNATVGATFGVNIGGQITPGNASTYIASAAIGSTLIGNAAIGTAHIGDAQITTLKVAGQAITASHRIVAVDQLTIDSTSRSLITTTVNPAGGLVIGIFTCFVETISGSGDAYGELLVVVDGLPYYPAQKFGVRSNSGTAQFSIPVTVTFEVTGNPTSMYVEAKAIPNPGGSTASFHAKSISLVILNGKR